MLSEQDLRELAQRKARFRGAYPVTYDDLGELWTAILNLLPLPEQPQSQICDTPAAKLHESAVAPLPPDPAPAEQDAPVYTEVMTLLGRRFNDNEKRRKLLIECFIACGGSAPYTHEELAAAREQGRMEALATQPDPQTWMQHMADEVAATRKAALTEGLAEGHSAGLLAARKVCQERARRHEAKRLACLQDNNDLTGAALHNTKAREARSCEDAILSEPGHCIAGALAGGQE